MVYGYLNGKQIKRIKAIDGCLSSQKVNQIDQLKDLGGDNSLPWLQFCHPKQALTNIAN